MLKTFTGFKGCAAFAQIGDVKFAILAKNSRQLAALWTHIMANAGPLDPAGVKKAILIESKLLPEPGRADGGPHASGPQPAASEHISEP